MKRNHEILLNRQFHDLNPVRAGESQLPPGQRTFRPHAEQMFTLLHYIVSGKGTVVDNGKEIPVHAGQMFIHHPGEAGAYCADKDDPWTYRWVGFTGSLSTAFEALPRVFDAPREMFPYLEDKWDNEDNLEFRLASDLFFLYAELIQQKKHKQDYIQMTLDYVGRSYMHELSLQNIAHHVGLNSHYLSRIFKKKTGISLQSHILNVRLREAKRYLQLGYSTKETANLCGFSDTSNFSKLFKRENGASPATWKKQKDALNATMKKQEPDTE